ncbi:MAG: hypothetical protein NC340_00185 [Ruminococcus flavefaciens]|nr:hypothetical protein [Ruminococcus flavefaciens]MCM1228529.1 hypothetical protein [Ruminococcus flavefaciens]
MSKLIKNLEKIAPDEEILEGTFTSAFFSNDEGNELVVCLRNGDIIDYAEKCIEHFNSLSDDIIDEICEGIIESCEEEYDLENARDILEYCWFTSMAVDVPEDDGISYVIEGEGDWGEVVGFVIKNGALAYVGIDFEEYL